MSKNLKLIITEATNHCQNLRRDVKILVPKSTITQAYSAFMESTGTVKKKVQYADKTLTLAMGEISGVSDQHYDTVYVINPQEMEDDVLEEIKAIPNKDGLLICVKL